MSPSENLDPVAALMVAYNKRDLDAFCKNVSDDIEVFVLGHSIPLVQGKEAFKNYYRDIFDNSPDLKCRLQKEFKVGAWICRVEEIQGRHGFPGTTTVMALYDVQADLIKKIYVVK